MKVQIKPITTGKTSRLLLLATTIFEQSGSSEERAIVFFILSYAGMHPVGTEIHPEEVWAYYLQLPIHENSENNEVKRRTFNAAWRLVERIIFDEAEFS